MKKFIVLVLCLVLLFLCSCSLSKGGSGMRRASYKNSAEVCVINK